MRRDLRWVALGAAFIVVVFLRCGLDGALMYAASYALALALGIDNVLVISLMLVTRRLPSGNLCNCTISLMAAAICERIVASPMVKPAMPTICSRRTTASRGLLAWIVVRLPS